VLLKGGWVDALRALINNPNADPEQIDRAIKILAATTDTATARRLRSIRQI